VLSQKGGEFLTQTGTSGSLTEDYKLNMTNLGRSGITLYKQFVRDASNRAVWSAMGLS
jgi:hypothetical protein